MRREIKFRVWDSGLKTLKPVAEILWDAHGTMDVRNSLSINAPALIHETLEQYTGLKDKNGVEIYEGDIVRLVHSFEDLSGTGAVEFSNDDFRYRVVVEHWIPSLGERNLSYEVIGNIHENPELLTLQKDIRKD